MAGGRVIELLGCLQLADSAFPSGLYTLSHGLEGYAEARRVDGQTLTALLADLLRHSVGPADGVASALAHRGALSGDWDLVAAADHRLYATKLNRELRTAATRTGRQLVQVAATVFGSPAVERYAAMVAERRVPGCQAVAAGVVYAAAGVDVEEAVASELFAYSASFAGAALRLRLADHVTAQVLLRETAPVIAEVSEDAVGRTLADLGGCAPMADVMSGRHERATARLFTT
ncbi:urease accessory protein UreF [Rhodococcus sp. ACT016]|uniref:urease accessory protein UreF n=1 Tax=Rhodococcus sp. ACT016 TaxID=3134808 RepID=UPI003D2D88DA